MMTRVERRLNEVSEVQQSVKKVYIVTGTIREGKTVAGETYGLLAEKGVGGSILALRIVEDGRTTGYDVSDITSRRRTRC